MGICNVTPDSFSDGGRYLDRDAAKAHVDRLLAEGADIIDIGGESTRPGCEPAPPAVQIDRVIDVVRYAAQKTCVSIDTTSAEVAARRNTSDNSSPKSSRASPAEATPR